MLGRNMIFTIGLTLLLVNMVVAEDIIQPIHQEMLEKNNVLRATRGLPPHELDKSLIQAAQDHAEFMARTGSRSHYSNGGPGVRVRRFNWKGGGCLENIAWSQNGVASVFQTWRNSGGHWGNMTSRTNKAGFGYAISANGTKCWVAVYGTEK